MQWELHLKSLLIVGEEAVFPLGKHPAFEMNEVVHQIVRRAVQLQAGMLKIEFKQKFDLVSGKEHIPQKNVQIDGYGKFGAVHFPHPRNVDPEDFQIFRRIAFEKKVSRVRGFVEIAGIVQTREKFEVFNAVCLPQCFVSGAEFAAGHKDPAVGGTV